ncbi:MAG: hypothetical protein M5R36_17060 [Deltaproteobacteria bacterium]|nr:hypothetical protein [Deltaproteobacteria bacterium]
MPDQVHLLFTPMINEDGAPYTLAEIMCGIKESSSHSINKALDRKGRVWQDESFDHILRSSESRYRKAEYICFNPVRKGLCSEPDEYPWLWRNENDDF